MKKILILANASGYGGAEVSIELLIKYWKNKYSLLVLVENEELFSSLTNMNKELSIIKLSKGNSLVVWIENILLTRKMIKKFKPEFFLTNTNKGALLLAIMSILLPIEKEKCIVYVRDFQWKFKKIIFFILKKAIVAVPTMATLYYSNSGYINNERIIETYDPMNIKDDDICDGTTKESTRYIVALANISRLKGIHLLLIAYKKSGLYNDGVSLRIYGKIADKEYYDELNEYVKKEGLSGKVIFYSFTDNVNNIYKNACLVVNTSISKYGGPETLGRTIIEGWNFKKPVLAFKTGGAKCIIDDGVNGCLIPEEDTDAFAEKMIEITKNEEMAKRMGDNGYQKVKKFFSIESVSNSIEYYIR